MDRAAPIGVVGTGYVGLVSAVCFAHLGHHVVCMDVDAAKIERLRSGDVPIYEPGLDKLVDDNASRLSFTTSYDELLEACRDPLHRRRHAAVAVRRRRPLARAARDRARSRARGGERLLVMKSTVPVGTGEKVMADLEALGAAGIDLRVATPSSCARAPPSRTSSSRTASSSAPPARRTATRSRRSTAASTPTSCAPACRPPR